MTTLWSLGPLIPPFCSRKYTIVQIAMITTVTIGNRRVGMSSFSGIKSRQVGIPILLAAVLAGCGGSSAPKTDADAVAQTVKNAAKAVAHQDGDKACSYLTADAQRQAELQVGFGQLGSVDCPTLVKRATAFMSPLDRKQIEDLQPTNVVVNGNTASATLATQTGSAQPGASVQLNLTKVGNDWKISGFANAQGLPGG